MTNMCALHSNLAGILSGSERQLLHIYQLLSIEMFRIFFTRLH